MEVITSFTLLPTFSKWKSIPEQFINFEEKKETKIIRTKQYFDQSDSDATDEDT